MNVSGVLDQADCVASRKVERPWTGMVAASSMKQYRPCGQKRE